MGASGFDETIIGEDMMAAVTEVVDGLVPDYTDGLVTLTVGSDSGVKAGTVFSINKVVRETKHPFTGDVIRRVQENIGTMTAQDGGADWVMGTFAGSGTLACDSSDFYCRVATVGD
jgi:hypothetical protein